MIARRTWLVALAIVVGVGCGGDGSGDGGSSGAGGTAGTGGTTGTGGTAGSGGSAGSGGTSGSGGAAGAGGMGGSAGSAGAGGQGGAGGAAGAGGAGGAGGGAGSGAASIDCDPFVTLDDFQMAGGAAQFPTLARSGNHAAAIWGERVSGYEGVAVARYDFTTSTWSEPFDVFAEPSPGFTPVYDVAVNDDGDVAALWREVRGSAHSLWVRLYDASTSTWSAPEEITSDSYASIQAQQIEYDRSTGEPMVVFLAPVSSRRNAYFTKRGSSGWPTETLIENEDADSLSTEMDFVSNGTGQALFVYFINAGGTVPTWYVLPYDNGDFRRDGSNVLDPFSFSTDAVSGTPQSDLADTGDGIVLIDDSVGMGPELLAAQVDVDVGNLAGPTVVADGQSSQTFWLRDTAISESGRAVAAWGQTEQILGNQVPWVSVYDGAWSAPQQVGVLPIGTAGVKTDIDENGTITVVWTSGFAGVLATRNTGSGGSFLPQQELTGMVAGTGEVEVAAHSSGDFLSVWQEGGDIRAGRCR